MIIKNLIETDDAISKGIKKSSKKFEMDPNQNFISPKNIVNNNYVEDKTSDDYIPKSYRSQGIVNRFLTACLRLCGITFLQPIKWKNVVPIFLIHLYTLYIVIAFPVFEVKVMTIVWGKLQYLLECLDVCLLRLFFIISSSNI